MDFDKDDRVETPMGSGVVVYKRMAPPDYSKVEAYSVCLDNRKNNPNYKGTIFQTEQVKKRST